jgi:hypothetical protein
MRRGLWLALGASGLASAWALWGSLPDKDRAGTCPLIAAIASADRPATVSHAQTTLQTPDRIALAASTPLPHTLQPWQLDVAVRDPFVPYALPPPAEPPVPSPEGKKPVRPEPIAEPVRTAPPMDYRFLGRMLTPEGRPITLLARGDTTIEVQPGQQLDDGYRVEAVSEQAIRLAYPSLGTVVDVPIPPATGL